MPLFADDDGVQRIVYGGSIRAGDDAERATTRAAPIMKARRRRLHPVIAGMPPWENGGNDFTSMALVAARAARDAGVVTCGWSPGGHHPPNGYPGFVAVAATFAQKLGAGPVCRSARHAACASGSQAAECRLLVLAEFL